MTERSAILASVRRAFLGTIGPDVRMVTATVAADKSAVKISVVFDGVVSDDDRECISVAESEVISDIWPAVAVSHEIASVDFPAPVSADPRSEPIYQRDDERQRHLRRLLECPAELDRILRELGRFAWECDATLAVVTRAHLAGALEMYAPARLETVEAWANAIEGREDIGLESGYEDLVGEVIHRLANPELTAPTSPAELTRVLARLRG